MGKDCGHKVPCGCKDTGLLTPPPCGDGVNCPDSNPCSETFNASCIYYTGEDIVCDETPVVNQDDTVAEALANIVNYFCQNSGEPVLAEGIQCPEQPIGGVSPAGTPFTEALQDVVTYFCGLITPPPIYQVYRANLVQEGGQDPFAYLFETTLNDQFQSGIPQPARFGVGEYVLALPFGFTPNTHVLVNHVGKKLGIVRAYYQDNNNIAIRTYTTAFVPSDDILDNTSIEIKVYPYPL
jgi:hypothetical protein